MPEVLKAPKDLMGITIKKVEEIFAKLDANKDSYISKVEFVKGLRNDLEMANVILTLRSVDDLRNEAERVFQGIDENADRKISKEEFFNYFSEYLEQEQSEARAFEARQAEAKKVDQERRKQFDRCKEDQNWQDHRHDKCNVKVEEAERQRTKSEVERQAEMEAVKEVWAKFKEFDLNGDGVISEEELGAVLMKLKPGKFKRAHITTMFQAADTNGDGIIDFHEFFSWLSQPKASKSGKGRHH